MYLFYYNQLNNEEKKIYWFIKDALFSLEPRIYINDSYIPTQRLKEISWMITLDYPELYWTKGSFEINEKTGDRELRPAYLLSKDDIDRYDDYIFSEISNISIGQRDIEEKICSVCNWMIENVRYDTDKYALKNKANQTVLSVFVEKKSLCMGISKAFKLIAGLLDIESIIAIGDIFDDKKHGHAWDVVDIDNRKFQVDITMQYPDFSKKLEEVYAINNKETIMVPYEEISLSHKFDDRFSFKE